MDPLHPDFRAALKRAHPGLTDAVIDRYEDLTSRQFMLNPDLNAQQFATLDREREKLLKEHMPKYEEIWRQFSRERNRRQ